MNVPLIIAFWRQRLVSPLRMFILFFVAIAPLLVVSAMPAAGLNLLGEALPIGMIFAVGMIGQDVSSGVLQLVFARPVRRWEYVISRWLGAALAGAIVVAVQAAAAWGLLAARGNALGAATIFSFAGERVLEMFAIAAVMALFSSLLAGFGDLALYVILSVVGGLFALAGQAKGWGFATRLGEIIHGALTSKIDFDVISSGGIQAWLVVITYLSTIAVCLALTVAVMNRKQLSYASG